MKASGMRSRAPELDGPEKLARTEAVLARLGDPQAGLRAIHVAGTNGKGSVCALLASILAEAGLAIGRYTSPHLASWTERIWARGSSPSPDTFEALMAEVRRAEKEALGDATLGEFARVTAAAFLYFKRAAVDVAILEAGRGGRFDATNVAFDPLLSIVTNVADDHLDVLGPSLADVAWHKAGIARPGRPLLTQATGEAHDVLSRVCAERGATLVPVAPAIPLDADARSQRITCGGRTWDVSLLGTYQVHNTATALAAAGLLREAGLRLPDAAIEAGLERVSWPGRMEAFESASGRWLFDGAHNPAGVEELLNSLDRHLPDEEIVLVFGAMRDKPATRMAVRLAARAKVLILTAPPSPSAFDPAELARDLGPLHLWVIPEPTEALVAAQHVADGRRILVCGSLYLVGLARRWLGIGPQDGTPAEQCGLKQSWAPI